MRRSSFSRCVSLLVLAAGCTGTIADDPGAPAVTSDTPGDRSATPSAAACPAPKAMVIEGGYRRLSSAELRNTFRAVLGEAVWKAVAAAFDNLPPEPSEIGKRDPLHSEADVSGLVELAALAAETIVDQPANRTAIVGACATSATPDRACVEAFIKRFAGLAMRRPPTAAEVSAWLAQYDAAEADLRLKALVGRVLTAPGTLFLAEDLGDVDGGRSRLTPVEVAARLSYGLTQGPPDGALSSAAARGALATSDDVRREAERLADSDAGRATMRAAFESWLELAKLPQPHLHNLAPHELAATGVREDLQKETLDFVENVARKGGGIAALLTDDVVFPGTAALARIYGVTMAAGPIAPKQPRPGLLTRAALFAEASAGTSPILRGAHLQQRLMCIEYGLPDNLAVDARRQEVDRELDPLKASNRQLAERLTAAPQCAGCHNAINPVGFVLESFDGVGAWRNEQPVLDGDGRIVARYPIDARVRLALPGEAPADVDGPEQFAAYVARHPRFVADCSARGLVEFVQQRRAPVKPAGDPCAADAVGDGLRKGASLRDAFVATVAHDGIFYRGAR